MAPRKKQARIVSPEDPQHNNGGNTIVLDLPDGEVDRANANHHVRLHAALAVLSACDLLADISAQSPLHIAANNSAEAAGLQAPFAQAGFLRSFHEQELSTQLPSTSAGNIGITRPLRAFPCAAMRSTP